MKCTKCESRKVLVESTGNGGHKRTCQACAYTEIFNSTGQKLLTDDMPGGQPRRRDLLVEG
jgi:hypothetical protein